MISSVSADVSLILAGFLDSASNIFDRFAPVRGQFSLSEIMVCNVLLVRLIAKAILFFGFTSKMQ